MFRITSKTKVVMSHPDQGWSLTPGANHFESEMPDAVAAALVKLQANGTVKVEVIEGGAVGDWSPPKPADK